MKKFIITRLGLETVAKDGNGVHQEEDLDYAFKVIENMLDFTYPSIRNQTNKKDLVWCFYIGARFQEHHKKLISEVAEDIEVRFIRDIEFSSKTKPWELCSEFTMIRLDADDYMHPELLDMVEKETMKHYNGKNIVICGPQKGYKLFPNGKLAECEYPKIALGLSITSSCGAHAFHDHTKLRECYENKGEVIEVPLETDKRLYIYNRSVLSHSFDPIDYKRAAFLENTDDILSEFGALETPFIKRLKNEQDKFSSKEYWEDRYRSGRNSGSGSYGRLAAFKLGVLNDFIGENGISSLLDFGCGDGNIAKDIIVDSYVGYDVSAKAVEMCKELYAKDDKKFTNNLPNENADLCISFDVIFHLIEDGIYHEYIKNLFKHSDKYVIIYSSNVEHEGSYIHFMNRSFIGDVDLNKWELIKMVKNKYPLLDDPENESVSDFYIFKKRVVK